MTAVRRTTRTAVAGAAALLALAGCATTAADPGASSAGPSASGVPGPGVTDSTIKIGAIVLAGANSAGSGGFNVSPQGDTKKQAQIVVDAVNAAGGIGGRTVELVVREFDSSTDSPTTETAMCTSFTQDDEVFAVLLLGQRTTAARSCYKKASTVMVDISQAAQPVSTYSSLAPYYWTPNSRDLDSATSALIDELGSNGFLSGAKVGVLVEKEAAFEGVYTSVVTPALKELGITPVEQVIDQSTSENAFATAGSAAAGFQSEGVERILFLGRPDNVGYFTTFTTQQNYYPKLAIGSFETPTFIAQNPSVYAPKSLAGAKGIGFLPDVDGVTTLAFPQPGPEQTCIDTLSKGGITFPDRFEAKTALRFCDGFGFLKAAGDKVGTAALNADSLAAAAATLGETWQAATTLKTVVAPSGTQLFAPAAEFTSLSYDGGWFSYGPTATPFS